MKTQEWYEAVQVVSRQEDGRLREWWPGDPTTLPLAKEQKRKLAFENRGVEYTVIRHEVTEITLSIKAKVEAR